MFNIRKTIKGAVAAAIFTAAIGAINAGAYTSTITPVSITGNGTVQNGSHYAQLIDGYWQGKVYQPTDTTPATRTVDFTIDLGVKRTVNGVRVIAGWSGIDFKEIAIYGGTSANTFSDTPVKKLTSANENSTLTKESAPADISGKSGQGMVNVAFDGPEEYRYYKIKVTSLNEKIKIAEIEFYNEEKNLLQETGVRITASDNSYDSSGYTIAKVADGKYIDDSKGRYAAKGKSVSIEIDLGAEKTFNAFDIYPYYSSTLRVTGYKLYKGEMKNGSVVYNESPFAEKTGLTIDTVINKGLNTYSDTNEKAHVKEYSNIHYTQSDFAPVTAQYIKLDVTGEGSVSIWEMGLYKRTERTDGAYNYVIDNTSEDTSAATVTGYSGGEAQLVIPQTLGSKSVSTIAPNAFTGDTALTEVLFKGDVSVESGAFNDNVKKYAKSGTAVTGADDVTYFTTDAIAMGESLSGGVYKGTLYNMTDTDITATGYIADYTDKKLNKVQKAQITIPANGRAVLDGDELTLDSIQGNTRVFILNGALKPVTMGK